MEQETKVHTSTKNHEMVAPLLDDGLYAAGKQLAGHGNSEIHIRFADKEHLEFFAGQSSMLNPDRYLKALIYTLGICDDTRRNFASLYNVKHRCIVPEEINAAWQTGGSLKVTRLAFQLFTDGTPSAYLNHDNPDFDECVKYSVSDIFCCGYAQYFTEAIRLRYPEYMGEGGVNAGLCI